MWRDHIRLQQFSVKAKFHYAIWSQTGPKLVTDLQRDGIWPTIYSSLLAASYHELAGLRPASDLSATIVMEFGILAETSCEHGRRPVRSQKQLRYLVEDRSEAGRRPASSF